MALALQLNGTMTLDQVMQPGIELADGFVMYNFLAEVFASQQKATSKYKSAYDTYYPGGALPKTGAIFRQPNLARTMRIIAEADRAEFARQQGSQGRHSGRARRLLQGRYRPSHRCRDGGGRRPDAL